MAWRTECILLIMYCACLCCMSYRCNVFVDNLLVSSMQSKHDFSPSLTPFRQKHTFSKGIYLCVLNNPPPSQETIFNSCCETIFERKGSKTFSTLLYSCISFIWISFLRGEFRCLCVMYNFFKCLAIYTSSNAYKFSYKDSISGGFSSCSMHLPLDWMIVPLPSAL